MPMTTRKAANRNLFKIPFRPLGYYGRKRTALLEMKLAFPHRTIIHYPMRQPERHRYASKLDRKGKLQFFGDAPPLSQEFCIFHFLTSHSAERRISPL